MRHRSDKSRDRLNLPATASEPLTVRQSGYRATLAAAAVASLPLAVAAAFLLIFAAPTAGPSTPTGGGVARPASETSPGKSPAGPAAEALSPARIAPALALRAGPPAVVLDPPTATQSGGANLTFHLTNTGDRPVTTVRVELPADSAVAEMYPLSTGDWAPRLDERRLAVPLDTVHGGQQVNAAPYAITWFAVPGHALAPGGAADLPITLGPLPSTTSMRFLVTTTYAGGRPGPPVTPPVLRLTPAAPAGNRAAAHVDHGGVTAPESATGTGAPGAARGGGRQIAYLLSGVMVAALVGGAMRLRRRVVTPGS